MSGHSKWSSIKHKKGAADAKRAKIFGKIIKEITVAAKLGGDDDSANPSLRAAILKAKAANMPKDTIDRAIKKGAGGDNTADYTELLYEGYAGGGVAILIEALTDNKNRTAADVRSTLTKLGGTLGTANSVSYLFQRKGMINYDANTYSEDQIFEPALEAGAEDVSSSDDIIEVITPFEDYLSVLEAMQAAGFQETESDLTRIPDTSVQLSNEDTAKVLKIVERLEDLDDVQNVFTNLDIPEDFDIEDM